MAEDKVVAEVKAPVKKEKKTADVKSGVKSTGVKTGGIK